MQVSVVMSTYNSGKFLGDAIESILNQDMNDLELIVVDDGSTDDTPKILGKFSNPKVRVFTLPVNCGIATARNVGMAMMSGKYLAVMDADDISFPNRLSLQVAYMESNPSIDILGARVIRTKETIDQEIDRTSHPLTDAEIKSQLLLLNGSAMSHPTMMARVSFLKNNNLIYPPPPRGRIGEDHQFWIKCVQMGAKFAAVPDFLLYKRRHQSNVSLLMYEEELAEKRTLSRSELLALFYPEMTLNEIKALASLLQEKKKFTVMEICDGVSAAKKALFSTKSVYGESHQILNAIISKHLKLALSSLSRI